MEINKIEGILYFKTYEDIDLSKYNFLGDHNLYIVFGVIKDLYEIINNYQKGIIYYYIEEKALNPLMDLFKFKKTNARIEYGTLIRDKVFIHNKAIVLMGAIINVGAYIDEDSMIDMGAVIGSKARIGKRVHVGANAVISGVLEPESNKEVIIEDDVFIGANAVILEGVKVGHNSIVGAGSIVTKDVPPSVVVIGNPARIIKEAKEVNKNVSLNYKLR